jgi:hypothetical protein
VNIGGLYRDKQRENFYDGYTLKPDGDINGPDGQQTWSGIENLQ